MKSLSCIMFVVSLFALSTTARAHDSLSAPLYTCTLVGDIHGKSIAIGIGGQYLRGNGTIRCINNFVGDEVAIPIYMKLVGAGIGLDFTVVKSIRVYSAGIGVNDPHDFVRSYSVGATAGATLIHAGIDFDAAIRVAGDAGFGFEVGMKGREAHGLGAHLYGMSFKISRRN